MIAFPPRATAQSPDGDAQAQRQRAISLEEQHARWEVLAAQWRAHELAEAIFGRIKRTEMLGLRPTGPVRGLLHLEVPFTDLDTHRERERRFLTDAACDPILSRVHLIYVVGPETA